VLIVGEVQTSLLRAPVTKDQAERLADLVAGEPVLISERPQAYVRSPEKPVGVDCALGSPSGGRPVRGVGTVLQRSVIVGGHISQGSAFATIVQSEHTTRQAWSHYLARPGLIEAIGGSRWAELADALASASDLAGELDLGEIASRSAEAVQGTGPIQVRAGHTRFRWVATVEPDARVHLTIRRGELRVLRLADRVHDLAQVVAAAEDVAMHDWLLTVLLELTQKAAIGLPDLETTLGRLRPAVVYLLHLWMPNARGDALTADVWSALERRPGFSRQWNTLVQWIRDQLAVGAVARLSTASTQ